MNRRISAFIIPIALVLFAACQKEGGGAIASFKAVGESACSPKTHLEPDADSRSFGVKWDQHDTLAIYGDASNVKYKYITDNNNTEVAYFSPMAGEVSGSSFRAFYPASIATGPSSVTLPNKQPYRSHAGGTGYVTRFPMYAETENNNLYFKNLCALFVLRLKGPAGAVIHQVKVSEPTYPYQETYALAGIFAVGSHGGIPALTPSSASYAVTLSDCEYTIGSADDDNLFYFYLPAGSHQWLNISVNYTLASTGSGGGSETKTYTKTIAAPSYSGHSTFNFERSRWTGIDVDLREEMDINNGIGRGLLYSGENLTFGEPGSIANTDTRITDAYGDYTILIDVTPSSLNTNNHSNTYRCYTMFDETNPSQTSGGLLIRYQRPNNSNYMIIADGPQGSSDFLSLSSAYADNNDDRDNFRIGSGVRNRIAVTVCTAVYEGYSANQIRLYASSYHNIAASTSSEQYQWVSATNCDVTDINESAWVTTHNTDSIRSVVGGDQYDVDNPDLYSGRYNLMGTIHKIYIYNRVITPTERENWLNGQPITGTEGK